MELSFHDGTVRDLVFMQDVTNQSSLLISGGAGDCKIYVTDCVSGAPIRAMMGHTGERKMRQTDRQERDRERGEREREKEKGTTVYTV